MQEVKGVGAGLTAAALLGMVIQYHTLFVIGFFFFLGYLGV